MIRHTTYSLALCAVAGAAFLAGSWHGRDEGVSAAAAPKARRVLYYVDPMHPAYKSDAPGTAPDCGMALTPVYADTVPDAAASTPAPAGTIAVSAATQQLIGVRVGAVEEAAGHERVRLFGRVVADETRAYRVNVGGDGYVRELSGVTTGSRVVKDQWLATVSIPEARQPLQAFFVTLDVLDREMKNAGRSDEQIALARMGVDYAAERLLTVGMSPVQIEEIRHTRVVPTTLKITAPGDGIVVERNLTLGEKLGRGTEIYRIADLRHVWILADIPVGDAQRIEQGSLVDVAIAGRPSLVRARVSTSVIPQFDPATQSTKLRLELDNPGLALRPDMFVDVEARVPYARALAVPADAVVASGLRNTVFVEVGPGLFEPRTIETGRRIGDRLTVLRGLNAGDRIALSGTFLLDSESRMKTHDRADR
jgi:Cu(I)/Ag(I) efflux system membrane fusion protein